MLEMLESFLILTKLTMNNFVDELRSDERGVSNIVATVILILIVVLLAALFWTNLQTYFTDLWNRVTSTSDGIS